MANVIINKFKSELAKGNIDLENDQLKISLIDNIFALSANNDIADIIAFSAVSGDWEISGDGYVIGGKELSGAEIIQNDTTNIVTLSANNMSWESSTINAYGAIIYLESNSLPILVINFLGLQSSISEVFSINWSNNIILNFI
jgi:hypothetical protein